jgi:cell division protein FtsI/penicillin-binding protein 2
MAVGGVAVIVLAAVFHGGGTSPEPTVAQFLLDWETGQYQQAAALTTGPSATVASTLRDAYKDLYATDLTLGMVGVSQHGGSAVASFAASVDLGSTSLLWRYQGSLALREIGQTWKVVWSPSVVEPHLRSDERLALVLLPEQRKQIYAEDGQSLLVPSETYEIGVYPGKLHGAEITSTADQLQQVLGMPAATATALAGEIGASINPPHYFQELFTLTPARYAQVAASIKAIPGLVVKKDMQRLYDSIAPDVVGQVGTETAPILVDMGIPYRPGTTVGLDGLQANYQDQLTGTAGTGIVIENDRGVALAYLRLWTGQPGKALVTTIDHGMQEAANTALGQVPGSAALVAVQAGSGKILAVSSRQGAGMPDLNPLSGQYEPGQAFTIVSSAMFLSGGLTPDSPLPCNPSNPVNGTPFYNIPTEPHMGQTTKFSKDFAVGCSTAFVGKSESMTGSQLVTAADEFGIGARWQLPGANAFSGTVGPVSNEVGVAAATIGRGGVRVSPLAMALAAGVADSGHLSAPSLVTGGPDPKTAVKAALSPQVLADLQGLMRDEAAHGSGALADAGSGLYGQAGVAPYMVGHKKMYISWFVGYDGTTAFAIAELVKSPSDSAAPLAGSFLRNIQAGY